MRVSVVVRGCPRAGGRGLIFARQGAQFRVLDLEPLHYRQDAHVAEDDCLHLCIPGPLNAIVPPLLTRVLGGLS